MHWIKDKESAFQNVYKHLKFGGRFAFVCTEKCPSIFSELLTPQVKESYYLCSSDVYESIALKCGFEVEFKSVVPTQYIYANAILIGFLPLIQIRSIRIFWRNLLRGLAQSQ